MLVLGIETSCDETAASVVEDGRWVRSDVVSSQIQVHAEYGGVVPEVASRQHVATIVPVLRRAVAEAGVALSDLDGIAVTAGPGLVGALLVGVETAKALGYALGKPLVGVNHLAGHLAAVFLDDRPRVVGAGRPPPPTPPDPHLALLVSGGHTALIRVDGPGVTTLLGATRDDAAGEAFDKVGKMLGLGYPGGVAIDQLAATGDPHALALPRALPRRDDLDFSFSGLKTAVSMMLQGRRRPRGERARRLRASFQAAVVDVLCASRAARSRARAPAPGRVRRRRRQPRAARRARRRGGRGRLPALHSAAQALHRQRVDDRGRRDAAARARRRAPARPQRRSRAAALSCGDGLAGTGA